MPVVLGAGFFPSSDTSLQAFPHFLPSQTCGFAVITTSSLSPPIMSAAAWLQVLLILLTDTQNLD